MARTRTTKKLAQRIDLNYFKRLTPLKRAKFWLSLVLPLLAVFWIAWHGFPGDQRVYSSGRLSRAHAVLEKECAACHVQQAGAFSAKAADSACLECHDGPTHHENEVGAAVPACATCHREHRGRIQLYAASNEGCAACHGNLRVTSGRLHHAANIRSFEDGHPEFAALRPVGGIPAHDPSAIKLNHAIHMKPIRRGPNGPTVQLECGDCHRNYQTVWKYALSQYPPLPEYRSHRDMPIDNLPFPLPTLKPIAPSNGRERMRPVEFAYACSGCHLLTFDKRFDEGVPHDNPEVVHAFLIQKFREYIATHPDEVRVVRDPSRDLTGKPLPPEVRVLTPPQWVAERTADAEELLWRKTCVQCHALTARFADDELPASPTSPTSWLRTADDDRRVLRPLPEIAPAVAIWQWMPHAKFDHDAHRGFTCAGCHPKALTSAEAGDILLPGIATCKICHAPGPDHADSRCSECHTYHDWSKRKEVTPKFTLPALRTGGR